MTSEECFTIQSIDSPNEATLVLNGTVDEKVLVKATEALRDEYAAPLDEDELEQEAFLDLIAEKIEEILKERDLDTVDLPAIALKKGGGSGVRHFEVTLSLYPTPEIIGYDKFSIEIESRLVTEEKINSILSKILEAYRKEKEDPEIELSDSIAAELVSGVQSVVELREYLREREQQRCEALDLEEMREAIFEQLVQKNHFVLPVALIDEEIRGFALADGKISSDLAKSRKKFPVESFREEYREKAESRARLTVIIDRISEIEDIYAEEEEIEEAIEEIARLHNSTFEETHEYLMENGFILEVILAVTQEKVFEFLLERAVVKRKDVYH